MARSEVHGGEGPMIHRPSREQALCAPPIDRDMLRRTLPNLVENAIRDGSDITILEPTNLSTAAHSDF